MLFFGDRERPADPRAELGEVEARLATLEGLPPGPVRHGALARAVIRAGMLAQGLADAPGGAGADEAMALVTALARRLWRSHRTGGRAPAGTPGAAGRLAAAALPAEVRVRRPEGFALYALYPETYAAAARDLRAERAWLAVVGVRSIGTTLAAMVAAGAGSEAVPFTVRPGGHPYDRRVALPEGLVRRGAVVAIADEGPGLSGSSLAATARALLEAGVPEDHLHLFPSHRGGPGPAATPATRALLGRLRLHHASLERLLLGHGPLALARLAEDVIGRVDGPIRELGGGAWRALAPGAAGAPSTGWLERRKFLLAAGGRRWLARFVGLGEEGPRKLARAEALAGARLWVAPAALRHGLLFEPWLDGARPLPAAPPARAALLDSVARLVALTASRPCPAWAGAPPAALAELVRVNAAEALGEEAAHAAARLAALVPALERQVRPVEVDGRLAPWKWHVLPGGRVLKADGVDHHAGHELAGCQDALWDVAGAGLELDLGAREVWALAERARKVGPGADPAFLPFFQAAYAALELGRWALAAAAAPPGPERARREAERGRYRAALAAALERIPRGRSTDAAPRA